MINCLKQNISLLKYWFLLAYALASFFPKTLQLPGLPSQVQLTEVLFVCGAPFFTKELRRVIRLRPWFAVAAAVYGLANLGASYLSGSTNSLLEAGGRIYLLLLAGMVAGTFLAPVNNRVDQRTDLPYWKAKVPHFWATATMMICCGVLFFYVSGVLGGPGLGRAVYLIEDYPYFGTVFRMAGTGSSYGMFCMLILPGVIFGGRRVLRGKWPWWYLLPVALAGVLTFAKENVLFVLGLLLLSEAEAYLRRSYRLVVAAFLVLGLYGVTHFMVLGADNKIEGREFVSDRIVWQNPAGLRIIETNYMAHKRGALALLPNRPLLGYGPGEFQNHTALLVPDGKYPAHLVGFNPHSIWTGALVETGLLGLLGLLLLGASLWFYRPAEMTSVTIILLLFLVASIFKDVMNFRGLWWLIGWYLVVDGNRLPAQTA